MPSPPSGLDVFVELFETREGIFDTLRGAPERIGDFVSELALQRDEADPRIQANALADAVEMRSGLGILESSEELANSLGHDSF